MLSQDFVEAGPPDGASAISPRQPLLPYPHDLVGEPLQSSLVAADAIVGEVAPHHRGQVAMLVGYGSVSVFPAPVGYRGQRTGVAAFGRHLPDQGLSLPRPSPHVGKAEEVEVGPIRFRMALAVCRQGAEVDDACLVRVEREPKAGKTLAHHRQNALGIDKSVEHHHRKGHGRGRLRRRPNYLPTAPRKQRARWISAFQRMIFPFP